MSSKNLAGFRYWILLLAWFGWVFDIADSAIFNFAKGPMLIQMMGAPEYRVSGAMVEARLQSGFLLGWSIGGLVFGILADRWGRTRVLLLTVLLYCLFTGLTALCHTPEQVFFTRFLTALGVGGEWAAGAALVAEAFTDRERPFAAGVLQTAAAIGPALAALASLALDHRPWQWLFLIGVAPALFCVFARFGVHDPLPVAKTDKIPLAEILSDRRYLKRVVASMVVGAVGIAGAGTATFWLPNLVREASLGMSPAEVVSRTAKVAMVSHVGTLLGVFACPWLCKRIGRKKTIATFFLMSPLCVLFAVGGGVSYMRLLLLAPLVNLFAIGVSAAFVLYFPELFPTRFRATGAGLAYNVGRFLSIPLPLLTSAAIARFGHSAGAGVLLSGGVYVFGLFALPFLPETMGKTLGEAAA
jgi:MFS family permease